MSSMGLTSNVITSLVQINAALNSCQTNGRSVLGTLEAPLLPDFLRNNPLPNGFPWGPASADHTNPYTQAPNTGEAALVLLRIESI